MKSMLAIIFTIALLLLLTACGSAQRQATTPAGANEAETYQVQTPPEFETHSLGDITIRVPVSWEIYLEVTPDENLGGFGLSWRDLDFEVVRWGYIDLYNSLTVSVVTEYWALSNTPAEEYIDFRYEFLLADWKEKVILIIDGVEVGMVSHTRPYPNFRLSQLYFQHGGKEYFIGIHYNYTDEETAMIANEILNSISIISQATE